MEIFDTNTNSPSSEKFELKLSNKILIGTHHKTGTVWLRSIFKKICLKYSLNFYDGIQDNLPEQFDVFLQDHSKFDVNSLGMEFFGIHLIRDPRDVIISGCFYHQKADEKWLHIPRNQFNGLTYQQKINSFKNIDDQILFEMENIGKATVLDMINWDYTNPYFLELKYEDLIVDIDMVLFNKIYSFLGFPESIIPNLIEISFNNSLFSKKVNNKHIRSGKKNQWKKYFKQTHKERFIELFDDLLIQLGYEKDNNW